MSNALPHAVSVSAELKARYGGSYTAMREVLWENAPPIPAEQIPEPKPVALPANPSVAAVTKVVSEIGKTYTKKITASSIDPGRYDTNRFATCCTQCRNDGQTTVLEIGSPIIFYRDDTGKKQVDCIKHYK